MTVSSCKDELSFSLTVTFSAEDIFASIEDIFIP